MENSSEASSCLEHLDEVLDGLKSYEALAQMGPGNQDAWSDMSKSWRHVFIAAAFILGAVYLAIGILSTLLLVKKGSPRLKIRTFFAVYLNVSIMGFSRALLYCLDPFGMIGFIGGKFTGWLVVSRYLAVLGLPSFIASSTMIVFTLLKIMDVKRGKKWYEYWKYIIPISVTPYIIAILAESIAYASTYTAIVVGLLCESFFVLWGLTVCIAYLTAGLRLLKKLHKRNKEMTEAFENNTINNNQPTVMTKKQSKVYQKIMKITIGTTLTGLLYTITGAVATILAFLLLFQQCLGYMKRKSDPHVWLSLHIILRVLEINFSLLILYSVTDMSAIHSCIRRIKSRKTEEPPQKNERFNSHSLEYSSQQVGFEASMKLDKPKHGHPSEYQLRVIDNPRTAAANLASNSLGESLEATTTLELSSSYHHTQKH